MLESVFEKFRLQNVFVHTKTQSRRFQIFFSTLKSAFEKFGFRSFRWTIIRISVDGGPNRKNKVAFSNLSSVVWTRPKYTGACYAGDDTYFPESFQL